MTRQHRGWLLPALAALSLAAAPQASHAQTPPPPTAAPGQPDLSPAQQARVKARQQKFQQDIMALQADKSLTTAQKNAKGQALFKVMDADMLAILTPQQRAAVLQQRKTVMQQRQGQIAQAQAFQKAHQSEIAQGQTLAQKLNKSLTPAQKSRIAAIKKQYTAPAQKIAGNPSLTPQAKQQQLSALEQQMNAKIAPVLKPAQRADFVKMQQIKRGLYAAAMSQGHK